MCLSKPVVLLYEPIHEDALAILLEKAEAWWAESLDEDALARAVADVDGIIIRGRGEVSRRLIETAPRLKVIGRHGAGVDNIDC